MFVLVNKPAQAAHRKCFARRPLDALIWVPTYASFIVSYFGGHLREAARRADLTKEWNLELVHLPLLYKRSEQFSFFSLSPFNGINKIPEV